MAQPGDDPTPVTAMAQQLANDAGTSIKSLVDQISDLVDGATSLEQLRDDIIASYASLDDSKLQNILAMAFAAAELSGHYDAANE